MYTEINQYIHVCLLKEEKMAKELSITKKCKYCKTDIPRDAKICPNCQKKQGHGCLTKIIVSFIVLMILSALFSNNNDSDNKNNSASSSTEHSTETISTATTANSESSTETSSVTTNDENNQTKAVSEWHLYDTAQVKDLYNGLRTDIIGKYSVIECLSTEVNKAELTDWYYNYVSQNDYNWCIMIYLDTENRDNTYLGAYSTGNGFVENNVIFTENEYGEYEYSSNENATFYFDNGNGKLNKFTEEN